MATFQVILGDPESGRSYQFEVDGQDANRFLGREIGDTINGDPLGLEGVTLEITGGSDATGRPMREDVEGTALRELLLEGDVGYNPQREGERRRVTVRGREVSEDIVQLNAKVIEQGSQSIGVLLGEEEPPEEEESNEEASESEVTESETVSEEASSSEEAEESEETEE